VAGLEPVAEMTARFGDDLDAAFDHPAFARVGLEGIEGDASHVLRDELDVFDDVEEPGLC